MSMQPALILASASPRRRELLAQLGVVFTVVTAEVTEHAVSAPAPRPAPARAMKRRRETLDMRTILPNPRLASHQRSLNDHAGTAVR